MRAFGVPTIEVNGHDQEQVCAALLSTPEDAPLAILARTVKGHGVSFMEHRMEWHYLPMSAEQFAQAVREVGGA